LARVEHGKSSVLLLGAVVAGGLVAAFGKHRPPPPPPDERAQEQAPIDQSNDDPPGEQLPPGHPAIGGAAAPADREEDEPPAIDWKVPAKWSELPNPNTMRLATYHVPAAAGAPDEASVTVARAGGSVEANLQRWSGQFVDAGSGKRTEKTVKGLKVSLIELSGTFQPGGMGAEGEGPHRGYSLRGAVVETEEGAYFFKLTGPSASVRAARADFDSMIDSIESVDRSPSQ
jgi:hypothetical protein